MKYGQFYYIMKITNKEEYDKNIIEMNDQMIKLVLFEYKNHENNENLDRIVQYKKNDKKHK